LFVFDPWRSAILLVGGDKSADWSGWYRRAIPRAEELYAEYLGVPAGTRGGGEGPMTNFPRWTDIRADIVASAGGEQVVAEARRRNQAYIDGHRLAERRKMLGLTQTGVAERMGVTKSRVSQIERGEVSTVEAIARYVQALGGQIQISAVFGDDLYILRGTNTHAA
jgi:DNA-binding XRE family transcriptional regulator